MRKILAALTVLCPFAAHALQVPQPVKNGDPHVRVTAFNPSEPVLVVGAVWRPLTITFSAGEHIERVMLETESVVDGKVVPAPWTGPPEDKSGGTLGNVLPLWPTRAGRSSAEVVTQTADGAHRIYLYQLIALPQQPNECATDDCDDPRIITGLSYTYPEERKAINRAAVDQARVVAQRTAAEDRLKTDIFYGVRNWKYTVKGTEQAKQLLAPDEVSDNSQTTGFRWLGRRRVPSIYIVEHGQERLVTPETSRDLLVIHETAAHWRLRDGEDRNSVVDIDNLGYDPIGANPWTGTTSPNVLRTVRQ